MCSPGWRLKDGKPTFGYNDLSQERPTFAAKEALPKGKAKIVVDFVYDGKKGETGKGARLTLPVDGKTVAEGRLEKTIPIQISLGEGLDVGSAVDFNYKLPFRFTGKIETVVYLK